MCKYQAALELAKILAPHYGTDYHLDKHIERSIGTAVFDCPNIFTGNSTVDAVYSVRPGRTGVETTWEHMFSRSMTASVLIREIQRGRSDKFLITLIRSRCRVNITLKCENQLLKPYQNDTELAKSHPNVVYKKAGLVLTKFIGPKVYHIDGAIYDDRDQILKDYNISSNTLTYRFGSPAKAWKNWYIENMGKK